MGCCAASLAKAAKSLPEYPSAALKNIKAILENMIDNSTFIIILTVLLLVEGQGVPRDAHEQLDKTCDKGTEFPHTNKKCLKSGLSPYCTL